MKRETTRKRLIIRSWWYCGEWHYHFRKCFYIIVSCSSADFFFFNNFFIDNYVFVDSVPLVSQKDTKHTKRSEPPRLPRFHANTTRPLVLAWARPGRARQQNSSGHSGRLAAWAASGSPDVLVFPALKQCICLLYLHVLCTFRQDLHVISEYFPVKWLACFMGQMFCFKNLFHQSFVSLHAPSRVYRKKKNFR